MFKRFSIVLVFFWTSLSYGQNLVPNPGFEMGDGQYTGWRSINGTSYWEIPIFMDDGRESYIDLNNPIARSLACKISKGVFHPAEALACVVHDPARGGWADDFDMSPHAEAYEGSHALCMYLWLKYCPDQPRCYATVQLSEPLEKGKHYFISFKMTSGYTYLDRWATNGLGVYFSNHRLVQTFDFGRVDVHPQMELNNVFYEQNWTEVAFKFTADSNYQFLHLGNFRKDEELIIEEIKADTPKAYKIYYPLGYYGAYCFIDDVHVELYDPDKHIMKVEEFAKSNSTAQSNDETVIAGKDSLIIDRQGSITVEKRKITLTVEDYSEQDGDIISLYFNGKLVLKEYTLKKTAKKITIEIPPDVKTGYLVMKAHNVGSIPPNTSLLKVRDGKKEHIIQLSSTLTRSGMLELTLTE